MCLLLHTFWNCDASNYILVLNSPADVLRYFWPQKNQPKKETCYYYILMYTVFDFLKNTDVILCTYSYVQSITNVPNTWKSFNCTNYSWGGGGIWRTFWSLCSWSNLILDIGGHRSSRRKESHSCLGSHAGCTSTLKSCKYAAWSHSSPVHCRLDASGNGTGSNTCSCKSCDRKNNRSSNYCCYTSY